MTAVVAGFVISALGGSRVQIGGPTGAFIVIVYGVIHDHGMNGLLVAIPHGQRVEILNGSTLRLARLRGQHDALDDLAIATLDTKEPHDGIDEPLPDAAPAIGLSLIERPLELWIAQRLGHELGQVCRSG